MKNILVTGANKGIGFQSAYELLKLGHQVIISGRDEARLEHAKKKFQAFGFNPDVILIDMDSEASIKEAIEALHKKGVVLDVLINNAAINLDGDRSLWEMNLKEILETFRINTFGPLVLIREARKLLKTNARIINVSSGAGAICDGGSDYASIYSSSKTALNALTQHMSKNLWNEQMSINAVCPGWVRTDMGGSSAPRSLEEGAETIVWMATDANFNANGKFFRDKQEISW